MPPQERSYRWLHAIELAHTLIYHLLLQNPCVFFCLSMQCSSLVKIRLQRSTKARTALVMILHVISSFKKSQIPQSLHRITHCWPSSPVSRTSEVQWVSTGQSPGKGTVQGSSAKTVASLSFCLGPQVTTQTEVSSMCLEATSRLWRVFFKDEALQLNTFRGSISTGLAPQESWGWAMRRWQPQPCRGSRTTMLSLTYIATSKEFLSSREGFLFCSEWT